MKKCYLCQLEKEVNQFYKSKSRKDGLQTRCIECDKKYCKSDKKKEIQRNYEKLNKEIITLKKKEYKFKNKEKFKIYRRNDYLKHKQARLNWDKHYKKNKRKTNLIFNLNCKVQSAISNSL